MRCFSASSKFFSLACASASDCRMRGIHAVLSSFGSSEFPSATAFSASFTSESTCTAATWNSGSPVSVANSVASGSMSS